LLLNKIQCNNNCIFTRCWEWLDSIEHGLILLSNLFQSLRLPAPGPKISLPILSSAFASRNLWDSVFQLVHHLPAAGAMSKRLPCCCLTVCFCSSLWGLGCTPRTSAQTNILRVQQLPQSSCLGTLTERQVTGRFVLGLSVRAVKSMCMSRER
jgi:hypothetical protein